MATPSDVFLLVRKGTKGGLLCAYMPFLEEGQRLPNPGLQFAGARFDPAWGFAAAVIAKRHDGSCEFCIPHLHSECLDHGDVFGYRVCPVKDSEIPKVARELARIREQLALIRVQTSKRERYSTNIVEL